MSSLLARVETCLGDLESAITSGEADAIESRAQSLQQALADTMASAKTLTAATLTDELRQRLKAAQARARALQGPVHKALASTGRTLAILLPQEGNDTYGALGQSPAARALGKAYR